MEADSIADELYGLRPDEFTAARNARAGDLKKQGERELAKSITELRRPTWGAWLVNALVRKHSREIAKLLALGEEMRRAQEQFDGETLRSLSQKRAEMIGRLAQDANAIAEEAGQRASDELMRDVRTSLESAVADAKLAEELQRGRLITPLSYTGLGLPDFADHQLPTQVARRKPAPAPAPSRPTSTKNEPAEHSAGEAAKRAVAEAGKEVKAARREVEQKERQSAAAAKAVEDRQERTAKAEAELAQLRAATVKALEEARRAEKSLANAHKELSRAESKLADAAKAAEIRR